MSENILDQLADYARVRVEKSKAEVSSSEMKSRAVSIVSAQHDIDRFRFEKALAGSGISFICEVKKASPSKGLIAPDFPYLQIAREYEAAGAECISVLTEPKWFLGSSEYLKEITGAVKTPCIRKDFTVDEYMIYEAKTFGASAVLLICAILDEETVRRYISICDELGLSALVEAHDEREIGMAVSAGARLIGVNNRNLKNFTVDVGNSQHLRSLVPENILFVAESGIRTAEDVQALKDARVDACLVGESLMRAPDKAKKLSELRGGDCAETAHAADQTAKQ